MNRMRNQGFTLVELLIALALVSLVGTGLFSVYSMGNNAYIRDSSNSDLQYMARKAMQSITTDVVQASVVEIKPDQSLDLNSGGIKFYVSVTNNWLYRTASGSTQAVAENISSINFSNPVPGSNLLRITVNAKEGKSSYSLTSQVMPRMGVVGGGSAIPVTLSITVNNNTDVANKYNEGDNYFEYGATATETVNGVSSTIVSSRIIINNPVNMAVKGTYTVTYTIRDSSVSAVRTVKVCGAGDPDFKDGYIGDDGINGTFVLSSTAEGKFYISTDGGETWTTINPEFDYENGILGIIHYFDVNMNDVVSNGKEVIGVGEGRVFGRIGSSSNGSTWNDTGIELDSGGLNAVTWGQITPDTGLFVTVGNNLLINGGNSGRIYTSPDGSTWTPVTPLFDPLDHQLNDVFWGNNMFITVGNAGDIYTSSNGIDWISQNSGTYKNLNGVVWSQTANKFVVVGETGIILSSNTGQSGSWTAQTITIPGTPNPIKPKMNGVTWGVNKYVAVGDSATITVSTDGVSWNQVDFPPSIRLSLAGASIKKVCCSNGLYIATVDPNVKKDGKNMLLQSTDGVNWELKIVN